MGWQRDGIYQHLFLSQLLVSYLACMQQDIQGSVLHSLLLRCGKTPQLLAATAAAVRASLLVLSAGFQCFRSLVLVHYAMPFCMMMPAG
jgi:hypothetical protein